MPPCALTTRPFACRPTGQKRRERDWVGGRKITFAVSDNDDDDEDKFQAAPPPPPNNAQAARKSEAAACAAREAEVAAARVARTAREAAARAARAAEASRTTRDSLRAKGNPHKAGRLLAAAHPPAHTLVNLGNTCFANSLLQCLVGLRPFRAVAARHRDSGCQ